MCIRVSWSMSMSAQNKRRSASGSTHREMGSRRATGRLHACSCARSAAVPWARIFAARMRRRCRTMLNGADPTSTIVRPRHRAKVRSRCAPRCRLVAAVSVPAARRGDPGGARAQSRARRCAGESAREPGQLAQRIWHLFSVGRCRGRCDARTIQPRHHRPSGASHAVEPIQSIHPLLERELRA